MWLPSSGDLRRGLSEEVAADIQIIADLRSPKPVSLTDQAQYALLALVSLSKHRGRSLAQNLVFSQLG